MSFKERYLRGDCSIDMINDYVEMWHGEGEIADVVVSVPYAFALGEVVADGVVLANVVGVDIVAYVVLTHLDAFALHLKNDASARAQIEWFEAADWTVDGAILGAVHNGVVAKGVVRGEVVDHAVDWTWCGCFVFHGYWCFVLLL